MPELCEECGVAFRTKSYSQPKPDGTTEMIEVIVEPMVVKAEKRYHAGEECAPEV